MIRNRTQEAKGTQGEKKKKEKEKDERDSLILFYMLNKQKHCKL